MTSQSTQGKILSLGVQTAFGTPQTTLKDIRPEGDYTIKDPVKVGNVPETVHADVNETEKPLTLERAADDAVTVKTMLRQATTAGGDSTLKKMYEAGGCTVVSGNDTTIDTYTSESSFVATDDNFGIGYGIVVELDNGQWLPALIKNYIGGATTPAMALPSASSVGKAINKCVTVTPGDSAEITASKLLTITETTKMKAPTNCKTISWQDCATVSHDEISLEPGEKIIFGFTLGGSDYTEGNTGSTSLPDNDFLDATPAKLFNSPYFEFAASDETNAIASTLGKLRTASITITKTAMQVPSTGDTTAVNDICGWITKQDTTQAYLTLEMLWTQDELDRWNGTNASYHIAVTQPGTSETDPSMSFVMPNAHMNEAPTIDKSGDMYVVTSTFVGNPAGYDGTTATDQGNQPWYLLLGERSA